MKQPEKNQKRRSIIYALFVALVIQSAGISINAQVYTEADLTFKFTTISTNSGFSPKHILATWIEDSNGFVITKLIQADRRIQYLYTWNDQSSGNTTDAVTGATLSNHIAHTVNWDCLDRSGNIVPDGDYTIWVEFTSEHAQGPLYSYTFTKGTDSLAVDLDNVTNFKDLSLSYEPVAPVELTADFSYTVNDLTVTFSNLSAGATSYNWDFGDGSNSTDESPVHTYAEADTFHIVLEATSEGNTVSKEADIILEETTAIFSPASGNYKLFPNPASDKLSLLTSESAAPSRLEIYTINGQLVKSVYPSQEKILSIDIKNLQAGAYLLKVHGAEDVVLPFVKR